MFLNGDDPFCRSIRQTTQQHAVDNAEDRGARADTQRERDHDDRREPRMLQQPPHAITNVFDDRVHNNQSIHRFCRLFLCNLWMAFHSYLSATSGSTFVARSAGTKHAIKATANNNPATTANVIGSLALTWNSNVDITFVSMNAPINPTTTPTTASIIPCRTTSFSTSCRRAPSAMRTPISWVRCATV